MTDRDPVIEELVAAEKLVEAAARCVAIGDVSRAIALLERAARPGEAAEVAEAAGELAIAVRLVAMARDLPRLSRLAARLDVETATRLARELADAGRSLGAAALFARAGDQRAAASAWLAAGETARAADAFTLAGDDRAAARLLVERLALAPDDADAALSMARLCVAHARWPAAAEVLQRLARHRPLPAEGERLLARSLAELGLGPPASVHASLAAPAAGEVPTAAPEEAALLFGRWQVTGEVSSSPTARVLAATDRLTGRRVAIKLLRPSQLTEGRDAVDRMAREARALALLGHPRVVPLLSWVPEGPALVFPWMSGGSLAEVLARGALTPARAAEIARALLEALSLAHRIDIVHRDVKPANVLFDEAGAPHLSDFGAAHVGDAAVTVTAGLIGTLAYMAPEQREGRPATRASDLYAVGAVLHECLTGATFREGAAPPSAGNDALGAAHDAMVMRFLARSPTDRPASADAALTDLLSLNWPDVAPVTAPPRRTTQRPEARARFRDPMGATFDELLERPVLLVPLDDATRARARAFARIDREVFAAIHGIDAAGTRLVVERARGTPLARALTVDEHDALRAALHALHREGVAHGGVQRAQLMDDGEGHLLLAFPGTRHDATTDGDLADLDRLRA